jgi:ATP-dependent Lon protease
MNNIDNNLINETEKDLEIIKEIGSRLKIHYKLLFTDGIITSGEYYSAMEKLKGKYLEIIKNERIVKLIKEFNISILFFKLEKIKEDLLVIKKELHLMIINNGYTSITNILNIFIDNNNTISTVSKKIGIINDYFIVIDFKKYSDDENNIDKNLNDDNKLILSKSNELIIYKNNSFSNNSDIKIEIENDTYKKDDTGNKHNEFTETINGEIILKNSYINLIYEINKAIIKIEIGKNSYVFTGYFKEDTFNEVYLNEAFEGKYLKIMSYYDNNENKPNDYEKYKLFAFEYMNQYSIKDFIIKNIDNIIKEIDSEYIKNIEISKKTIQELIDIMVGKDLYNKRQIIIHGLISDNCKKNDNIKINNKCHYYDDDIKLDIKINHDENKDIVYEKNKIKENKNDTSFSQKIPKLQKAKMNKITATRYAINSLVRNINSEGSIELLVYNSNRTINSNILIDFLKNNILKAHEFNSFKKSIHINLRKKIFIKENDKQQDKTKEEMTWEMKLETLDLTDFEKSKVNEKIKEYKTGGKDNSKAESFIDSFFQIPFGKYVKEDIFKNCEDSNERMNNYLNIINENENEKIDKNDTTEQIIRKQKKMNKNISEIVGNFIKEKHEISKIKNNYLNYADTVLKNAIYGHDDSKRQIKREIAKWLSSGTTDGMVLGFYGPPGVGKTTLAREGISKCLVDNDGNYRPFSMIQLGGQSDGSTFNGHNYTYIGSKCGELVEMLKKSKCMNPILFFDELDKVSNDAKGKDIISILIHLTDKSQNKEMHDKYFSGINFDFSKCIIIFSYNDRELINKTLMDRITEIKVEPLKVHEKVEITKKFTLSGLSKKINYNCKMDDESIKYIIENYTYEPGMRKLNEKIEEIFSEINLKNIENKLSKYFTLDEQNIDLILDRHTKILRNKIHNEPKPGLVNGLYATTIGIGGITLIQIDKRELTDKKDLHIEITGSLGDVMKESIHCAKTVALNLLTENERNELKKTLEEKPFSLHIHCPDSATPKDGPSAGITITLAIYSFITKRKVRNDIAMTGEIDLYGNVKAIGGLSAKINGAIKAGVKKVLFPKENEEHYNKIIRKNLLDGEMEYKMVEHISQVLEESLIN